MIKEVVKHVKQKNNMNLITKNEWELLIRKI